MPTNVSFTPQQKLTQRSLLSVFFNYSDCLLALMAAFSFRQPSRSTAKL